MQYTNENNTPSREAQRVESMKSYLAKNLAANLHVASVAQHFKLSVSSVHHLFKKHAGRPYRQYLEETRMNKALELLQAEGTRIKEVMYATGYKNRKTFNNAFKKRFGYSPGHFKK